MNAEQRKVWETILKHQQAVTRASRFWAADDKPAGLTLATWAALNETANTMLTELWAYKDSCEETNAVPTA
jgi:hypothetical protein